MNATWLGEILAYSILGWMVLRVARSLKLHSSSERFIWCLVVVGVPLIGYLIFLLAVQYRPADRVYMEKARKPHG